MDPWRKKRKEIKSCPNNYPAIYCYWKVYCSFKVTRRAASRHWLSEMEIICIFLSLVPTGDTFGACLPDMSTLFLVSNCFLSTISCEGQWSHIWINMHFGLPSMKITWEAKMGRQTNLKAGWKKAIGNADGGSRSLSGGRGQEERRRGSFEKHAAGGRRCIFVVCIHIWITHT